MKRKMKITLCLLALIATLTGCGSTETAETSTVTTSATPETTAQAEQTETTEQTTTAEETSDESDSEEFTDRDLDPSYDESEVVNIDLSDSETYTISEEGIYYLTGSFTNSQIVVDTDSEAKVQLVLDNVEISNDILAPIYVSQADKVFVTIVDGTTSTLTVNGAITDDGDTNIDGVIFSKDDLVINGSGTLVINSPENGIVGKDDLKLCNVNLVIDAGNHGLEANDSIRVSGADINIESDEDGFNVGDDDVDDSYIYIESGDIEISAGDDGMHCEQTITVEGGTITILESYEGIEAATITINGGLVDITSSDDGMNATSGSGFNSNGAQLVINGGTVYVDASGDGLDSNGSLIINGGYVYVLQSGGGNGPIDYNTTGTVNGGTVIAVGSSDMLQSISSSVQGTILTTVSGNGDVVLTDSDGNVIAEMDTDRSYQGIYVTAPDIASGETYTLTTGSATTEITMTELNYSTGSFGMMGGGGMTGGKNHMK